MITPSFLITATERVLPRLALDFTTASLDPRITFTRALNTATRVNASGFVETVNADIARFDYDPVTLACKGLLIEESRQNTLTYSEDFTNAIWDTVGTVTVTPNTDISPAGTQTASTIVFAASNCVLNQNSAISLVGQVVSGSIYMKGTSGETIQIAVGGVDEVFTFDGTWQRLSASKTALNNSININTFGGVTARTMKVWGAQLETGAFPTSYIPTTTTSLTRNADVATMTGTNFSDWFNASAGTFFINTNARNADVLLTAGTYTLLANATALKKYATTYTADPSATSLTFGKGTIQKVNYYKQALLAAELSALVA